MSAAISASGSGKCAPTTSPPSAWQRSAQSARSSTTAAPTRPSGAPPDAIGRTGRRAPSRARWPSMFWRFSVPSRTMWRPSGRGEVARPQVGDVGELVAELGREQVDERDVLGGRLEQGGRRRQEVDVRIRGHPAGGTQVDRAFELELELARPAVDDDLRPDRTMIEALDDLDLDGARRQVDRERARHVGVGVAAQDQPGPGVLERGRVDLLAVAERRQVAAVGGHEPDPARGHLAVRRDPDLDPDVGRGQRLGSRSCRPDPEAAATRSAAATRQPPTESVASGAIAMSTTTGDPSAPASGGSVAAGSRDPQPIGPASRVRPAGRASAGRDLDHHAEVDLGQRRRPCPRRGPAGGPTARAGRPSRRTGSARR